MARLYNTSSDYEEYLTYTGDPANSTYDNSGYTYDRPTVKYDDGLTPVGPTDYANPANTYNQIGGTYTPNYVLRDATGTGTGTGTATGLHTHVRTATGTGAGTSTATGLHTHIRAATGTGTGSDTPATWVQLYLFRTPADNQVDFTGSDYYHGNMIPANRLIWQLYRHYTPGPRGRNVWKLTDGTYTENQPPEDTDIDIVYYGGHDHHVDATERAALIAAGYGDYVN